MRWKMLFTFTDYGSVLAAPLEEYHRRVAIDLRTLLETLLEIERFEGSDTHKQFRHFVATLPSARFTLVVRR